MFLLAVVFGFLAFLFDVFFWEGLSLPIKISGSLLVVVLFLLARRDKEALLAAVVSGLLIDLSAPFFPFGAMIVWHAVIFVIARKILTMFFAINRQSSIFVFSFLLAVIYGTGYYGILFLRGWLAGQQAFLPFGNTLTKILLTAVSFSFLALSVLAVKKYLQRLLRRWFLIR